MASSLMSSFRQLLGKLAWRQVQFELLNMSRWTTTQDLCIQLALSLRFYHQAVSHLCDPGAGASHELPTSVFTILVRFRVLSEWVRSRPSAQLELEMTRSTPVLRLKNTILLSTILAGMGAHYVQLIAIQNLLREQVRHCIPRHTHLVHKF